jgi:hypothetical protein
MQYLVRQNPRALGFSGKDAGRLYKKYTGRSASKDYDSAKKTAGSAVQQKASAFTLGIGDGLSGMIQVELEKTMSNVVNSLINQIPNPQALDALGAEIGRKVKEAIQENVLPLIFKRVDDAVSSTEGLGFVSESKRRELYSKLLTSIPQTTSFKYDSSPIPIPEITLDIRTIVSKAMPYEKFSRIFDRVNPLVTSIKNNVKDTAVQTGVSLGLFVAINSFILGGIVTYGFVKLYNSVD